MNFKYLRKSHLFQQLISYTGFNIIEKLVPFLTLPLLVRVLSKGDIGLFVLYKTVFDILISLMTLSIVNTIILNFYKIEEVKFKKYFTNGVYLFFCVYLLFFVILYFLRDFISDFINFPSNYLIYILILVCFSFFTQLRQNIWRLNYKVKQYGLFTIGNVLSGNLLGLLFVFKFSYGWEGMLMGHMIGFGFFAVVAIFSFIKDKSFSSGINKEYVRDLFVVGVPLSIHRIGIWLGSASNKIIIAALIGVSATGSYGVGAIFATIIMVLEDAFSKAIVPYIYEKLRDGKFEYHIVKLSYKVYLFLILISIIFYFIGYFGVDIIFGQEYISTKKLIFPLIVAALFKGLYRLHTSFILFTKKTKEIMKITISTGVLNLITSYFLIKHFGLIGAAYSLVFINIIQYVFAYCVGNKLIPLPWLYIFNKNKK